MSLFAPVYDPPRRYANSAEGADEFTPKITFTSFLNYHPHDEVFAARCCSFDARSQSSRDLVRWRQIFPHALTTSVVAKGTKDTRYGLHSDIRPDTFSQFLAFAAFPLVKRRTILGRLTW